MSLVDLITSCKVDQKSPTSSQTSLQDENILSVGENQVLVDKISNARKEAMEGGCTPHTRTLTHVHIRSHTHITTFTL